MRVSRRRVRSSAARCAPRRPRAREPARRRARSATAGSTRSGDDLRGRRVLVVPGARRTKDAGGVEARPVGTERVREAKVRDLGVARVEGSPKRPVRVKVLSGSGPDHDRRLRLVRAARLGPSRRRHIRPTAPRPARCRSSFRSVASAARSRRRRRSRARVLVGPTRENRVGVVRGEEPGRERVIADAVADLEEVRRPALRLLALGGRLDPVVSRLTMRSRRPSRWRAALDHEVDDLRRPRRTGETRPARSARVRVVSLWPTRRSQRLGDGMAEDLRRRAAREVMGCRAHRGRVRASSRPPRGSAPARARRRPGPELGTSASWSSTRPSTTWSPSTRSPSPTRRSSSGRSGRRRRSASSGCTRAAGRLCAPGGSASTWTTSTSQPTTPIRRPSVVRSVERGALLEFAATLTEQERLVLACKYIDSEKEQGRVVIARQLGLPVPQVRRVERAINRKLERFVAIISAGSLCSHREPAIEALAGGTASAQQELAARVHLDHCSACKVAYVAHVKALRAGELQRRIAQLFPLPAGAEAGRRRGGPWDAVADWASRPSPPRRRARAPSWPPALAGSEQSLRRSWRRSASAARQFWAARPTAPRACSDRSIQGNRGRTSKLQSRGPRRIRQRSPAFGGSDAHSDPQGVRAPASRTQ